jgi:hypothetical protein
MRNVSMSTALTVEERLTILEKELAELKQGQSTVQAKHGWLAKITETFKGDPDFGEILRLGREIRMADALGENTNHESAKCESTK